MGLILSRKEGESIMIGNEIEIIIEKSGKNVKLRIEAPKDMNIARGELLNQKDNNGNKDCGWN